MRTRFSLKILFLLQTVLITGLFSFNSTKNVLAESSENGLYMGSVSMDEQMMCSEGGCNQKHGSCAKHCLGNEPINKIPFALMSFQTEEIPSCLSSFPELYYVICEDVFLENANRAPPIHTFLRSVIKLE